MNSRRFLGKEAYMKKFRYTEDGIITPWGYVGYTLLFLIPVVGQVFLVTYALSAMNINVRNYARGFFILLMIALVVFLGILII